MTRRALITAFALAALLVPAAPAAAQFQFQTSWGGTGSAQGQFTNPGLIAVGPDGSVYVADSGDNRIEKFTSDGAFVLAFDSTGSSAGQLRNPAAVAVGPDGTVYVTDTGNNRIQHFDTNGGFVGTWGQTGTLDGLFNSPQGIATGPDGSVYVADQGNSRVEQFFSDGTFNRSIASGTGGFALIRGVAVGPDGSLYVVDAGKNEVERFDANGVFQSVWGSSGSGDGQFNNPDGIAASAGGVYVADSGNNRIEKFTDTGAFVESLAPATSGDPALASPSAVAISPTGLIYVLGGTRMSSYTESGGANLPPPSTGETANAQPVSGTVKVKKPGRRTFQLVSAGEQIPIGSIVDVTKGTVDLTTTATDTTTQTARFYAGVFKLAQDKSPSPTTELQLFGGSFNKCPKPKAKPSAFDAAKKKVIRQLWGVGKGKFRTKGKYASAAIRGTQWLTQDRCDGTLVKVAQGSVLVHDIVKNINKVVNAGKSYLAAIKPPKKH